MRSSPRFQESSVVDLMRGSSANDRDFDVRRACFVVDEQQRAKSSNKQQSGRHTKILSELNTRRNVSHTTISQQRHSEHETVSFVANDSRKHVLAN
jgi:hypothetical protein